MTGSAEAAPEVESAPSWSALRAELSRQRAASRELGGPSAIAAVHERGRLTARERINALLDPGSFRELGALATGAIHAPGRAPRTAPADGVVTGWGDVEGRRTFVIADDGTLAAGARGPAGNRKADLVALLARNNGAPLVWLAESSVNRFQHTMGSQFAGVVQSRDGGRLPLRARHRGAASPVVLAILGHAVGRASFAASSSDLTVMTESTSSMALAGPAIVSGALGVDLTAAELGGADVHRRTGLVDIVATDEVRAMLAIRRYLSFVPAHSGSGPMWQPPSDPPQRRCDELVGIVPLNYRRAYDMRRVIETVIDDRDFLEVADRFAMNVSCGLARIGGHPVGIVANNPMHLAGIIEPKAIRKIMRFVQMCERLNMPLVVLQDQPGVMVGPQVEEERVFAYVHRLAETMRGVTVPVITVLVRKCYGFSYLILGSRAFGGDSVVAWPSASISLAGPEAGLSTVLARERRDGTLSLERRNELVQRYVTDARARSAALDGRIDDIIDPADTRAHIARQLAVFHRRAERITTDSKRVAEVP